MKKLMICLLALTFAMSLTAFAQQDNNMSQTQADQGAAKAPLMTLKGTGRRPMATSGIGVRQLTRTAKAGMRDESRRVERT